RHGPGHAPERRRDVALPDRRLVGAVVEARARVLPRAGLLDRRRPPAAGPPRPPVRAPRPAPRGAMAAGSGGPPGSRFPTTSSPSGRSIGAPHTRHNAPLGPFATGPSSASWSAPTGSKLVVVSDGG